MGNRIITKFGKSKSMTDEEIGEIQKVSKLSANEIKERYKEFMELYPTGKLTKEEFLHVFNLLDFDFDMSDQVACEKTFATFDKNKNGTIEFEEFLLAMLFLRPNTVESNIDLLFRWVDFSGDGYLDHKELTEFFESSVALGIVKDADSDYGKKMASEIFAVLGLNDNSKINKEQLIKGCKENPALLKKLYFDK